MILSEAKAIADKWLRYLSPSCERIEIAGSIRRGKAEPKDIELVCVPKLIGEPDLFGQELQVNLLERFFETTLFKVTGAHFVKNGPRYKQLALAETIHLDLFIVLPPAQWGVLFLIRTGPADYSHKFVTLKRYGGLLPSNMAVREGAIWLDGSIVRTPEETDVYQLIGAEWLAPEKRIA